jgi:hypothetical protein
VFSHIPAKLQFDEIFLIQKLMRLITHRVILYGFSVVDLYFAKGPELALLEVQAGQNTGKKVIVVESDDQDSLGTMTTSYLHRDQNLEHYSGDRHPEVCASAAFEDEPRKHVVKWRFVWRSI